MTSEVAILNKTAVALAADSAVTIETQENQKIYNTVNKLFTLSKYHPVGIMIYGEAELLGMPWESIIKTYRSNLQKQKFNTLKEYAQDFINFLENAHTLFPEKQQKDDALATILALFDYINDDIKETVQSFLNEHEEINEQQIENIIVETIEEHNNHWNELDPLPHLPENHAQTIINLYEEIIKEAINMVFEELPIPDKSSKQLRKICGNYFTKNQFLFMTSGIAIAGFGDKDIFPSIASFIIETIANNQLKYTEDRETTISFENTASIVPFAQSEMVHSFMEGIDPFLRHALEGYISEIVDKYPEIILDNIPQIEEDAKQELLTKLKDIGKSIYNDFTQETERYRVLNHVHPIIQSVAILPKDELAEMAESLVNLTSFRQKVSLDAETVGGPIDVAVISKGDGFIWIKRKHYFRAELNRSFFTNYYNDDLIE